MTARPRIQRPSRADLERLYVHARLSLRDTAAALGVTKDTARRALDEHGLERRPRGAKRSRLSDIPVALLEANVRAEGLRGHARTLGVDPATLLEHIRRERGAKRPRPRGGKGQK